MDRIRACKNQCRSREFLVDVDLRDAFVGGLCVVNQGSDLHFRADGEFVPVRTKFAVDEGQTKNTSV